jgi:hypothetical protein
MNVEEASSGESCAMHYKNGFAGAELRYSRKPFAAHTKLNAWRIAVDQEITDCDLRHSGYQVVLQQGVICLHRNFSKRSPLRVMIPTELSEKWVRHGRCEDRSHDSARDDHLVRRHFQFLFIIRRGFAAWSKAKRASVQESYRLRCR